MNLCCSLRYIWSSRKAMGVSSLLPLTVPFSSTGIICLCPPRADAVDCKYVSARYIQSANKIQRVLGAWTKTTELSCSTNSGVWLGRGSAHQSVTCTYGHLSEDVTLISGTFSASPLLDGSRLSSISQLFLQPRMLINKGREYMELFRRTAERPQGLGMYHYPLFWKKWRSQCQRDQEDRYQGERIISFLLPGLGSPSPRRRSGSRGGFLGCFSSLFIEVWCLEHFMIIFICTSQPSLAYFPRTIEL